MTEATVVHGIVLSSMPIGESDRRLLILTKEYGKLSAFARGARKPGSQMLAISQPFTYAEFKLYMGRSSNTLAGAEKVNYFAGLREDFEAMYYGMYFCELTDYFTREQNDDFPLMALLYSALIALEKSVICGKQGAEASEVMNRELIKSTFELKAVALFGEAPDLSKCMSCGLKLTERVLFVPGRHGCLCRDCVNRDAVIRAADIGEKAQEDSADEPVISWKGESGSVLSESALYAMQYVLANAPTKVFSFNLKEDVKREYVHAIECYIKRQVDRPMKSLEVIEQL